MKRVILIISGLIQFIYSQSFSSKVMFGFNGWKSSHYGYIDLMITYAQLLKETESANLYLELSYDGKGGGPSYAIDLDRFNSFEPEKIHLEYLTLAMKYQLLFNPSAKINNASLLVGPSISLLFSDSKSYMRFRTGLFIGIRFDFKKRNTLDIGVDLMVSPLYKTRQLNTQFSHNNKIHSAQLRMGLNL